MELLEYQRLAMRTRGDYSVCPKYNCKGTNCSPSHNVDRKLSQLTNAAMGLSGEAGEFTDLVKKIIFHGLPQSNEIIDKLHKELGDILWYIALAADALDFHLDEVAAANIKKLKKRYPNGFSEASSQQRLDLKELDMRET